MSDCTKENCIRCNTRLPVEDDNVGLWEYVFGLSFKDYVAGCMWNQIIFISVVFFIGYVLFSWIGLIIAFIFCLLMGCLEGGAVADINNDYPEEEYPPNVCSAGIKDCRICDNEYSHAFNVEYDKKYNKWYKIF